MRILVVEDLAGESIDVILDLVDAGHRIVRCQPVGPGVEPCVGIVGAGACPLAQPVDAVVDFRSGEGFELRELGALCATRNGTPVVSVGHAPPPFPSIRTTRQDLVETLAALPR